MTDRNAVRNFIIDAVNALLEEEGSPPDAGPGTVLLGKGSVLSSLLLVGLLVQVEDYCIEHGIPFVWAADAAMSEKRSQYRTVDSLADYICSLAENAGERSA